MAKMRVSELAKELDIQSKDIISYLNGFGLEIKSHSSNLDDKMISMIRGSVSINGGKLIVGNGADSAKKEDAEKKPAKKTEKKPAEPKKETAPAETKSETTEKPAEEKKEAAPVEKKEEPARINILGNVYVQQAERQAAKAAERAAQAQKEGRPQGGRPQGDRPQGERRFGDRPQGERRFGDRPQGNRPQGDRPQGERRFGDRPQGNRPQGEDRRASADSVTDRREIVRRAVWVRDRRTEALTRIVSLIRMRIRMQFRRDRQHVDVTMAETVPQAALRQISQMS